MTSLDILEWTIADLTHAMDRGEITAESLTKTYLNRISRFDRKGPNLRAMESINPSALAIAKQLDEERMQSGPRSRLHGIPIVLKANVDTADGLPTTAGSLALENHYANSDAYVVQKLRDAGAIILGKAAMTEWANFMTTGMPSGYSSLNGQVRNPYHLDSEPGGSSSGCAVALAANYCVGAIGTETARSIAHPCSQNAVVGIRPTMGLVSRTGLLPLSVTRDIAGPMARTVYDAALLFNAMVGFDEQDPTTKQAWHLLPTDYTSGLNENTAYNLRELRVGVPYQDFVSQLDEEEMSLFQDALEALKQLGVSVVEQTEIVTSDTLTSTEVLLYEFKGSINRYLAQSHAPVQSLRDVIAYNEKNAEKTLKYGQSLLERCESNTSGRFIEPDYIGTVDRDRKLAYDEGIQATLDKYQVEVLLFPRYFGAAIAAKAEVPSVYVPAGYTAKGIPFSITFTGTKFSDERLIQLAYAFEQATKHRKPPQLGEINHDE